MQRHNKIKAAVSKIIERYVIHKLILLYAHIRIRLGIKYTREIHKRESKPYIETQKDNKRIRNYIVLLDRIVKTKRGKNKGTLRLEEQLFWVNRQNFKSIRRAGWLPKGMHLDDLRKNAFYVSSMKRNYSEEYIAKEKAINKYINYLKEKHHIQ